MTPQDVRALPDREIVELLVNLKPADEAVAWIASVIADDAAYEGVRELRRRFGRITGSETVPTRMRSARTVSISRERWKSFFFRRRIALVDVGPMMEPPRCAGWGSVIGTKKKAGLYALDDLACALDMHVDDLIQQVASDDELDRLAISV